MEGATVYGAIPVYPSSSTNQTPSSPAPRASTGNPHSSSNRPQGNSSPGFEADSSEPASFSNGTSSTSAYPGPGVPPTIALGREQSSPSPPSYDDASEWNEHSPFRVRGARSAGWRDGVSSCEETRYEVSRGRDPGYSSGYVEYSGQGARDSFGGRAMSNELCDSGALYGLYNTGPLYGLLYDSWTMYEDTCNSNALCRELYDRGAILGSGASYGVSLGSSPRAGQNAGHGSRYGEHPGDEATYGADGVGSPGVQSPPDSENWSRSQFPATEEGEWSTTIWKRQWESGDMYRLEIRAISTISLEETGGELVPPPLFSGSSVTADLLGMAESDTDDSSDSSDVTG